MTTAPENCYLCGHLPSSKHHIVAWKSPAWKCLYGGHRPKAIISGLKDGSSVLEILDHDFEKRLQKADFDLLRVISDAYGHKGSSSPVIIFSIITDSNRKSPAGSSL